MRFLVLKSKLFDKGEDRNEEVDCEFKSRRRVIRKKGCAILIILQHNFLMTSGC